MDDIKIINGIGAKLASALNAAGVTNVRQIADLDVAAIEVIEGKMSWKGQKPAWDDLIAQAKALVAAEGPSGTDPQNAPDDPDKESEADSDEAKTLEHREAAVIVQEQSLAEEAERLKAELQSRSDELDEREAALHARQAELDASETSQNLPPRQPAPDDDDAGKLRVKVTGPKQGRWRAGLYFTSEPSEVAVTETQLEAIEADPRLSVAHF